MKTRYIAALAALLVALVPGVAGAQAADAIVYVVHGIPGVEVDVTAGGDVIIPGFTYGTIERLELPAGTYPIGVQLTDGTSVYPEADVTVAAGVVYVAVAHLGEDGAPAAGLFVAGVNTSTVAAGEARLTAYHLAAAPAVDILTGDTKLFEGVPNGGSGDLDVPAGTYPVAIAAAADNSVVVFEGDVPLAEGANTLVFAVGALDDDSFQPLVQVVSGLGETPTGVPSGDGPLAALDLTIATLALMVGLGALGAGRVLARRGA